MRDCRFLKGSQKHVFDFGDHLECIGIARRGDLKTMAVNLFVLNYDLDTNMKRHLEFESIYPSYSPICKIKIPQSGISTFYKDIKKPRLTRISIILNPSERPII